MNFNGSSPSLVVSGEGNLHLPVYRQGSQRPMMNHEGRQPAVFLDRDGVLVEDPHFLTAPGQLRILSGVPEAVRGLQGQFCIIVVTNQSGIARGLLTEEDLLVIHAELVRRLWVRGAVVDALHYCPHLPEAPVEAFRVQCDCRKPRPGMLLRAAKDWGIDLTRSFMVGDNARDLEAARASGVSAIMIGEGETEPAAPVTVVPDLARAAQLILATTERAESFPARRTSVYDHPAPCHSSQ